MRSRLVLASLVVVVGIAVYAGTVLATPPSAVTPTTYGIGKLSSFDTSGRIGAWKEKMDIRGASDIYVLSNTIAPGGSFGWHSHPGPSFVIVKSGTATFYMGADPMCRPHRTKRGHRGPRDGRRFVSSEGRNETNRPSRPRQLSLLETRAGGRATARPPTVISVAVRRLTSHRGASSPRSASPGRRNSLDYAGSTRRPPSKVQKF